jgi:hypothetical protein
MPVPMSGPKIVPSPPMTSIVTSIDMGVSPITADVMLWL